jgi:hypothetical protein
LARPETATSEQQSGAANYDLKSAIFCRRRRLDISSTHRQRDEP